MYFQEKAISKNKLESILGRPIKLGVRGSTTYFIRKYNPYGEQMDNPFEGHKCIFELYTKGLLLLTFKSDKRILVPIRFNEFDALKLTKGIETVDPYFLSPMWVLTKLGVSVDIARYFRVGSNEYHIDETVLKIKTAQFEMTITTNGYTFPGQEKFFSQSGLKHKTTIHYSFAGSQNL